MSDWQQQVTACPTCHEGWRPIDSPACERCSKGWQPIETAPKDVQILLFSPPEKLSHDPKQEADIRVACTRDWCWATHWMPLPAPPSRVPAAGE